MTTKKIDTEQILGFAAQIESDNQQLNKLLKESKSTVDSLASYHTGKAAEETRTSYETFANKFFQTYYDVLDKYVKFLRNTVAPAYETTEIEVAQLGSTLSGQFK